MKWLIPLLILGCTQSNPDNVSPQPAKDDRSVELHKRLFEAADKKDTAAAKALFTPASQQLLDSYFASVNTLPRPEEEQALGWNSFVAQHANLPERARKRTPYPLAEVNGTWHLDITAHKDVGFFSNLLPQPK